MATCVAVVAFAVKGLFHRLQQQPRLWRRELIIPAQPFIRTFTANRTSAVDPPQLFQIIVKAAS